jgi:extracellular factor (EF) 3-hydroxypalmitic acid methyl ester biosynthesis protein
MTAPLLPADRRMMESALDSALHSLLSNGPDMAIPKLEVALRALRREIGVDGWRRFCSEVCGPHALTAALREDPFTDHSWTRPRGYPGDAALIDFVYGLRGAHGATPLGRALFRHTTAVPAAEGVRHRRDRLARLIDAVAKEKGRPIRVLAVAAGHWREGALSTAVAEGEVAELVAIDQDEQSLSEIAVSHPAQRKQLLAHSVRHLLARHAEGIGQFDLVYAAGLYDYLDDRTSSRLTKRLFDRLANDGQLLVANFTPDCASAAFMEAFMRWWLIYRTPEQVHRFGGELPASASTDVEVAGCVAYFSAKH